MSNNLGIPVGAFKVAGTLAELFLDEKIGSFAHEERVQEKMLNALAEHRALLAPIVNIVYDEKLTSDQEIMPFYEQLGRSAPIKRELFEKQRSYEHEGFATLIFYPETQNFKMIKDGEQTFLTFPPELPKAQLSDRYGYLSHEEEPTSIRYRMLGPETYRSLREMVLPGSSVESQFPPGESGDRWEYVVKDERTILSAAIPKGEGPVRSIAVEPSLAKTAIAAGIIPAYG